MYLGIHSPFRQAKDPLPPGAERYESAKARHPFLQLKGLNDHVTGLQ